jgi:nitrogen fixation protein NifU and related proteins
MELSHLYQEVIIDHNKCPRNYREMTDAHCSAQGYNPLCGDKVTVYLKLQDNTITAASFQGCGCAISTASASLLTVALVGKTKQEAETLFHSFQQAVTEEDSDTSTLGKLQAFTGVREFPSRVKCATLAWHTLLAALQQKNVQVSTE